MREWPLEVLNLIFRNLQECYYSSEYLAQCALTCHSWNRASRPFLFSKLRIFLSSQLKKLTESIGINDTSAKYVKELDLTSISNLKLPLFRYIVRQCMNIEKLYFFSNQVNYSDIHFLMEIYGALTHLKEFTPPAFKKESKASVQCLDSQWESISNVTLNDKGTYHLLYDRLDEFRNLTQVNLSFWGFNDESTGDNYNSDNSDESHFDDFHRYDSDYDSGAKDVNYNHNNFSYNSALDNNEMLYKSLYEGLEEITKENDLELVRRFVIEVSDKFLNHKLAEKLCDIQPMLKLRYLELGSLDACSTIDDMLMLYIMRKFPNLKHLTIKNLFTGEDREKVRDRTTISPSALVDFLGYIYKLPECFVVGIPTKRKTPEVIKKLCTQLSKECPKPSSPCLKISYYDYKVDRENYNDSFHWSVNLLVLEISSSKGNNFRVNIVCDSREYSGQDELRSIAQVGDFFSHVEVYSTPAPAFCRVIKHIAKKLCWLNLIIY